MIESTCILFRKPIEIVNIPPSNIKLYVTWVEIKNFKKEFPLEIKKYQSSDKRESEEIMYKEMASTEEKTLTRNFKNLRINVDNEAPDDMVCHCPTYFNTENQVSC